MGRKPTETIQLATGPYHVTTENAKIQAERIKYRHYKPEELELAKDFIRKPYIVGTYYFDYYLMTYRAQQILEREDPQSLTALIPWMQRIDALLLKGKSVYLIEFKNRLVSQGIGELLTYRDLYIRQYESNKEVKMLYVVRHDDPTFHSTLEAQNISLIVVKPSISE